MPTKNTTAKPTHQQTEMDKLRQELLNDPKVRIGQSVLRDWKAEQILPPRAA